MQHWNRSEQVVQEVNQRQTLLTNLNGNTWMFACFCVWISNRLSCETKNKKKDDENNNKKHEKTIESFDSLSGFCFKLILTLQTSTKVFDQQQFDFPSFVQWNAAQIFQTYILLFSSSSFSQHWIQCLFVRLLVAIR